MSRWFVNPLQLVANVAEAVRIGQTRSDQWSYLCWLYHQKAFGRASPTPRHITFRLPPPLGAVQLAVRDNRGADQLVFGEVLIKRDYEVDVPEPATVLDLGGNVGLATLYFGRRWPRARLAVVEPIPGNLQMLRENLQLNGINATIFDAAVGVTDGTVSMAIAQLDCAHHIVAGDSAAGAISVRALSIPTIMQQLGWDRIGLLKMDIEGYESVLLRSHTEWLHRVDALCIEAFDGTISSDELRSIAQQHGFESLDLPSRLQVWKRPAKALPTT